MFIVSTSGSERQLLVGGPSDSFVLHPSWSPDGSWIAFAQTGTSGYHVAVSRPDATGYRQVTPDENVRSPVGRIAWSPDGRQIAFVTGYRTLNVVNADGTGSHPIWTAPTDIVTLAWRNSSAALAVSYEDSLSMVVERRAPKQLRFYVRSVGGLDLDGVVAHLSFSLPGTASARTPTGPCAGSGSLTCTIGSIPGDTGVPIDLTYRPLAAGRLTVTVSANATNEQGATSDDTVTARTTVSVCTTIGTPSADRLRVSRAGGDHVCAGGGNDTINAVNGKRDVVDGGPGRDTATVDRTDLVLRTEVVHRR